MICPLEYPCSSVSTVSHVFLPAFQPGGQVIKAVTDDPEAPRSAKETKDKVIDLVWPEVEKVPTCANWTWTMTILVPKVPKWGNWTWDASEVICA